MMIFLFAMGTPAHNSIKFTSRPVLIVEDNRLTATELQNLCKELGIDSQIAANGKKAIELVKSQTYSVFIVDLLLPVMSGQEFIQELKTLVQDPIILVETSLDSKETIIEVMKMGVFDYIIKPIDEELFQKTLLKALEFQYFKESEKNIIENEEIKLREQLEWLSYKETRLKTGDDSHEKHSIYNIKTSLSQGGGLGMTVSLIEMIQATAVANKDTYTIDKELLNMLFQNNQYSRQVLNGLDKISNLMDEKIQLKETSSQELLNSIEKISEKIKPFFKKKKLKFTLPIISKSHKISVDLEKILLAVEEILINAYKYSTNMSQINIFANSSKGFFCISVKNEVAREPYGGVPKEMEKLVIEPFFRLHPPVEDVISIEKFGMGLGLTVVDCLVRKHNGMFFIHDAIDHTGNKVSNCVLSEIFLPIQT